MNVPFVSRSHSGNKVKRITELQDSVQAVIFFQPTDGNTEEQKGSVYVTNLTKYMATIQRYEKIASNGGNDSDY